MNSRITVTCLFLLMAGVSPGQDDPLNFYLPESAGEKKEVKPADEKPPAVKSTPVRPPKLKPTPRRTPAPKKSLAETLNLSAQELSPDTTFDPPMDPYGLAQAFKQRWDYSTFLITAEEELKFRLDAARARTLRLARAFSALSNEVEIRQRNLGSAALAAYLLSRDQHAWNPVQGRNMTEAQMLAVQATMRQDISAMNSALSSYEILRHSLNESAEEVDRMETKGVAALASATGSLEDRNLVPTSEIARARTQSVLQERIVSVEALKATLAAENLSNAGDRRQSIASFAPPPPDAGRRPGPASPLPAMPSDEVMKAQPRGESLEAPVKTALVIPADINAPVYAVQSGVVMYAGPFRGYGSMVIVEHEKGLFTVYSHLGNVQVRERQPIETGTVIGRAGIPPELGKSGIHFQVRQGKAAVKPEVWLGEGQAEKLLTRR